MSAAARASLLRAPIVTELQPRGDTAWRARALALLTWAATAAGGAVMLGSDYAGNARGDHALRGAQAAARAAWEAVIVRESDEAGAAAAAAAAVAAAAAARDARLR
jgi:hypothetical protein